MVVKLNKKGEIPLKYFKDLIDIKKVKYYHIKHIPNKGLVVKFYNSKRKLMKLKTPKS
jgi:hypothetical protein